MKKIKKSLNMLQEQSEVWLNKLLIFIIILCSYCSSYSQDSLKGIEKIKIGAFAYFKSSVDSLFLFDYNGYSPNIKLLAEKITTMKSSVFGLKLCDRVDTTNFVLIDLWENPKGNIYEVSFYLNNFICGISQVDSSMNIINGGVSMSFLRYGEKIVLRSFIKVNSENKKYLIICCADNPNYKLRYYQKLNLDFTKSNKVKKISRLRKKEMKLILSTLLSSDLYHNLANLLYPKCNIEFNRLSIDEINPLYNVQSIRK